MASPPTSPRPAAVLLLAGGLLGCGPKVDRFTVDRVLARGLAVPDLGMVCGVGQSLAHPLAALTAADNPPKRAMVVAEVSAALCHEPDVWEAELAGARARHHLPLDGGRIEELRDARIREKRAHTLAARRFLRGFESMEAAWGPIGEVSGDAAPVCPRIAEKDEIVYLLGLFGGLNALLHDRAGGGELGVPLDLLPRIARATTCLDDDRWWQVPAAFRSGVWATIPGSGPDGIDPWAALDDAASAGAAQGVRLARAVQVLIAGNADRVDLVEKAIVAHAQSLSETSIDPRWALLDTYALYVSRHHSDLLWTEAEGLRTADFGVLPSQLSEESSGSPAESSGQADPFAADPFAADPFAAEPAEPPEAPSAPPAEEPPPAEEQ